MLEKIFYVFVVVLCQGPGPIGRLPIGQAEKEKIQTAFFGAGQKRRTRRD